MFFHSGRFITSTLLSKQTTNGLFGIAAPIIVACNYYDGGHVSCEKPMVQRRMTSIGRFALHTETVENPSILSFFMRLQEGHSFVTLPRLQHLWNSRMQRHERFQSMLVEKSVFHVDPQDAVKNISQSLSLRDDLATRMLSLQADYEDLWRLELVQDSNKQQQYLLFQGHHILGDGASMAAAFMDLSDEGAEMRARLHQMLTQRKRRKSSFWQRLLKRLKFVAWLIAGSIQAWMYQCSLQIKVLLFDPNPQKYLKTNGENDSDASDKQKRSIAWSIGFAPVEQIKWVAKQLSQKQQMTVNDVMTACLSAALTKQYQWHQERTKVVSENKKILPNIHHWHIALPVHLQGGVILPNESVSNKIGAMVVRVPAGSGEYCLQQVAQTLAAVKQTPVAFLSHYFARIVSNLTEYALLPKSWATGIFQAANARSIAVLSNNRGPDSLIHFDGVPVDAVVPFVPLPPGIPIGALLFSYNGEMTVSVSAESWMVPDANQFVIWMLEEYLNLLRAAKEKKI